MIRIYEKQLFPPKSCEKRLELTKHKLIQH